ncbi:8-amino-7-oxononanoate synthase [Candidatus Providencia siddallii]|uniref:8-amino-7-oxononanoate synthase n=1 Tax=Candidatus Providencia siddallii TaxID=1715285 RepID=A0A0M6W9H1_9GAMM|nr:8-amino-7-oxononanoate synthase [Candidatus Providencia siddallii]
MTWKLFIENQIKLYKKTSIWRERCCIDISNSRKLSFCGKTYLNFSSNDYLGISCNQMVINMWKNGIDQYGLGSGGSGHIIGYTKAHNNLEFKLAEWLGYSNALLFISGFAANQAVISALMTKKDRILADKLSHASIIEASIHTNAQVRRFHHNRIDSLDNLIKISFPGKTLVITEGIFSMDGDAAPIDELYNIAIKHNAWLMVDDAHGIGVVGNKGRGSCDLYGIKPEILVVTFGKAFGLSGAAVLCDKQISDFFIQKARHLIYSTSMPPAQAVAISEAVKQIQLADIARAKLNNNIKYFRDNFNLKYIRLSSSTTAIQPLIIGSNSQSQKLSRFLREKKYIWVQAIRPPTVPLGSARLRVTLNAMHQQSDIDILLEALNDFVFV